MLPSVDVNFRAIDIRRRFGGKEVDRMRHLGRIAESVQRDIMVHNFVCARRQNRRVNLARRYCIHTDAFRAKLMRHLTCKGRKRRF